MDVGVEPFTTGTGFQPLLAAHRFAAGGIALLVDQAPGAGVSGGVFASIVLRRVVLSQATLDIGCLANVALAG